MSTAIDRQQSGGDYVFGHSQQDFLVDSPDAVAQIVGTTLRLQKGEWFADRRLGVPYNTKVLGKYSGPTRDIVLRTAILGVPGVTGIPQFSSTLSRDTRAYTMRATIDTQFGRVKLVEPI